MALGHSFKFNSGVRFFKPLYVVATIVRSKELRGQLVNLAISFRIFSSNFKFSLVNYKYLINFFSLSVHYLVLVVLLLLEVAH